MSMMNSLKVCSNGPCKDVALGVFPINLFLANIYMSVERL